MAHAKTSLFTLLSGFVTLVMHGMTAFASSGPPPSLLEHWQSNSAAATTLRADDLLLGLHGVLLGLSVLTLVLWLSQRKNIHLLNLLMIAGLLVGLIALDGLGAPGLSADQGNLLQSIGFSGFGAAGALLCRHFLEADTRLPGLDRMLLVMALTFLLIPGVPVIMPELPALIPVLALTILLAGTATLGGILTWKTRRGGIFAFQAGWLLILAGCSVEIARNMGMLAINPITSHALQVTFAGAMIAFAAALSCANHARERTRMRNMDRELAAQSHLVEELRQTEQMLIHQIAQRNHELDNANRLLRGSKGPPGSDGHRDALTGLVNRPLLEDRIAHGIVRSLRHNAKVALILIDIDDFKAINTQFGRDFGDEVLMTIARRLSGIARAEDTVARLGADDFAIMLEDVFDADDIKRTTTAISVELAKPFKIREQKLLVSASVGHAFFPEDGKDADHLIKSADRGMYLARANGGANETATTHRDKPALDHA